MLASAIPAVYPESCNAIETAPRIAVGKSASKNPILCCHNADRLYTELHWSLLAMAVAELLVVTEQLAKKEHRSHGYTPVHRSLANTMRAIYNCLDELRAFVSAEADLFHRLSEAVTDSYKRQRSQKARFTPKQSEKKKIKPPQVRTIQRDEQEKLEKMAANVAA